MVKHATLIEGTCVLCHIKQFLKRQWLRSDVSVNFPLEKRFTCRCSEQHESQQRHFVQSQLRWRAQWLRPLTHGRKAWDGTSSIPSGGWSVMKANNTEGIVRGKKQNRK